MILSASRRTDIPCCYPEWFMNRIREGYVLARNPMNPRAVSRIALSPQSIDCIVFWTKDPQPFMPYLNELDALGYTYCFQFTFTPYEKAIEQNLRDKREIIETFQSLSQKIGKERVLWRYDPVLFSDLVDMTFHKEQFSRMCETLASYTKQVTLSLVDLYKKIKSPLIQPVPQALEAELWDFFGSTARACGLTPKSCCEAPQSALIEKGSCIDKALLEAICGCPLSLSPDKNQRQACSCVESIDVGAYHSCKNGCLYCYAGQGGEAHSPASPLLLGNLGPADTVKERTVRSNKLIQTKLF